MGEDIGVICQSCGREAPTRYVYFLENVGMVFMRRYREIKGNLCKECINKYFWETTPKTFFLGWWGTISFVVTLFALPNNVIRYLLTLGMPPVPPGATVPQLTDDSVKRLQPFTNEIFTRLNNKEKLEAIASDLQYKAGVSPAQVFLYVQAVVRAARQKQNAPR